ncbi:MAG: phage tail protein [Actinomyces sp.]|nr:MAG: phage tail protein [Actinomyces sp.]
MLPFELVLCALDDELASAWSRHCGDVAGVVVYTGDILALPDELAPDAVVSPANSHGYMRGGIDGVYRRHFGPGIEEAVRSAIATRHGGLLPVGEAEIVPTGDPRIAWLISAPTMTEPGTRLADATNAGLAAAAVFRLVTRGRFPDGPRAGEPVAEVVHRVAMPGLGTGVGGLSPDACAAAVRRALDGIDA